MTVTLTNAKGEQYMFSLNLDDVMAYEEAHPDWTLMDEISGAEGTIRFTTLNRLAQFIGYTYADFAKLGFGIEDLSKIYEEEITGLLGFSTEDSSPTEADA